MRRHLLPIALLALALPAVAQKDRDWPTFGLDHANTRLADLPAITPKTVKKLVPKWIYQSGVAATFQATPIVTGGRMYVSLPGSHVVALDARTGAELWRYTHKKRTEKLCCGPANRGVAVDDGRVFVATVDARLVALDAATGKPAWDIELARPDSALTESGEGIKGEVGGGSGVGAAAAPLVVDGKVIVGINGVGYGLHIDAQGRAGQLAAVVGIAGKYGGIGFLAAFDAKTGKRVWQFDTVRKPAEGGWEGDFVERTADGLPLNRNIAEERANAGKYADAWEYGGGSVWNAPAYDAKSGLLYFGTGNPSPQINDSTRPGDNLYTASLVAIDAKTGRHAWHFQQIPHDKWGYDVASPPLLFDHRETDGRVVPAVGQASKLGWFYVHDRATGALLYKSDAFVPQDNLFAAASREGTRITPGVAGGVNWSPAALDAQRGLAFVAAMHMPMRYWIKESAATADKPAQRYDSMEPADEAQWGVLAAIDLKKRGKLKWSVKTEQPLIGGVLALKSGVVFTGEGDGHLSAFDSLSGKRLWRFQTGAGVNAPPIAYVLDGKPYVAVAAGGSAIWGYRQGDAVVVFGLPD
ncbi:MAG: PQQ-binding-like beta-propeller repeat protein [Methyloversatilis discipulorum]|uniref:pyrroloquinoline quinone-dependent dehydrogenase n=1 Tax=Methyloversatilis discipulorum TaxID=1119528 RepID=UPI0026F22C96|nr:PQQ-binding-like beta-propeller repeat protein [Methyloversatilis discipulorum]MBV5285394.1 PQQ-binding-like beta-propeller repeat protein [Methyloversatilis discipulorum]